MFVAGAAEGIDLEKKLVSVGEEQLQSLGFEGPGGIWFQVSTCTIILYYIILYYINYIILYYIILCIYKYLYIKTK